MSSLEASPRKKLKQPEGISAAAFVANEKLVYLMTSEQPLRSVSLLFCCQLI
jgi:hypothetical protein